MFAGRFFGARYFGGRHFGKAGLTVPGYYTGSRYFGSRYFGPSYFGSDETSIPFEIVQTAGVSLVGVLLTSGSAVFGTDFEVTQTSGISLSGSLALAGNLTYPNEDWSITPPLELRALVGTLSIECDLEFGGGVALPSGGYWGRRFWGANYFGQRYFGTGDSFAIVQTAGIGLTGTLTAASGIAQALGLNPSALGLTGTLLTTSGMSFGDPWDLVLTNTLGLSATLGVSCNIYFAGAALGQEERVFQSHLATSASRTSRLTTQVPLTSDLTEEADLYSHV